MWITRSLSILGLPGIFGLSDTTLQAIAESTQKLNPEELSALALKFAAEHGVGDSDLLDELLTERFKYTPNDETWDHLRGYLEYLYYFGVFDYIPQFHWSS